MVDSVLSRVLCEKTGVFGIKEQAALHHCFDSFVRHSGLQEEAAMNHMVSRWEEYEQAAPNLKWTYGSGYRFFMSGMWNKPDMWPWREQTGPDPNVGVYRRIV